MFLNALFEADCVTAAGQPRLTVSLDGPLVIAVQELPVEQDYAIKYDNQGHGAALDAELRAVVAGGAVELVAADAGAVSPERATWSVGSIAGLTRQPDDPPTTGGRGATVRFSEFGAFDVSVELGYRVGLSNLEASPQAVTIRVLLDTDGDGIPDEDDPTPDGGTLGGCGCEAAGVGGVVPSAVGLGLALLLLRRRESMREASSKHRDS